MLKDVNFKSLYATGEDEPCEFYLDALMNSVEFDLALGYFSSSGFRTLALGFAFFIKRGGRMRILINNVLSQEDKEAIAEGTTAPAESLIEKYITDDIILLKDTLSKKDRHFFKCLSWLIATGKLEIKACIPKKNKIGIVHQKFGLFKDEASDVLAYTGSANFSASALVHNVEDLWCDFSWIGHSISTDRIKKFEQLFYKAWNGLSDVVEIIPLDNIQTTIKTSFPVDGMEELIAEELDLVVEETNNELSNSYKTKIESLNAGLQELSKESENTAPVRALRPYQKEAIAYWKNNNYVGILEMATGTGKTFTALTALQDLLAEKKRLVIIISTPFIHLSEQWQDEAKKFGLKSILVGESKHLWEAEAARQSQLFQRGKIDLLVLVTTNASFTSENFQKIIRPNNASTLLIIDEVHYAGAASIRAALPQDCPYRLGLSATPERHGDDEGTTILFDYFGKIVFSFPIQDAIGVYLTNYYYHPKPVELTEEEFEEYCKLTKQIQMFVGKSDLDSQGRLEMTLFKRARLQNNSVNKLVWLKDNIKDLPLAYSLFYAGDKIFTDVKQLLGRDMKISLHEFTSRQTRAERKKLLADFASQKIQSLIAMKCLDEGVDVPPTRTAYFLASSSNPREFVQRRGRVLRAFEGKDHAVIYDLISIPPLKYLNEGRTGSNYNAAKTAFTKEYKRVQEFASMALNRFDSMNELFAMANKLDLLDITKD